MTLADANSFPGIGHVRRTSRHPVWHGWTRDVPPTAWSPARQQWLGVSFTWPARISPWPADPPAKFTRRKVAEIMQQSLKTGSPFIFINDSGGARVQEGIDSLSGYGKVFYHNVMLSGAVPQISLDLRTVRGWRGIQPRR